VQEPPIGLKPDGTVVWPNGPHAEWWERLAWGAYGADGWGDGLLYAGQVTVHGIFPHRSR
jgi:hypothetical protein